jgi:hypothetical protein
MKWNLEFIVRKQVHQELCRRGMELVPFFDAMMRLIPVRGVLRWWKDPEHDCWVFEQEVGK